MTKPKITVIIPTRERSDVLGASLKTVTTQDYSNLDILVSDNCSTDQTRAVVQATRDPRIRYVNTGHRVGLSQNWEFALSHVSEGFVMVLGDDDGLVPGALDRIAAVISETGVKAVNSTFCTFLWPSSENEGAGRLLIPMRSGFEVRSGREWLRRVVNGRAWYSELPMLYAGGATHISLIQEIRRRKGTFFQSCQPDVFSSIALASITDRYVFSHEPFAIAGHSRHSNGASWGASGRGASTEDKLEATKKFFSEGNIPWHDAIPMLDEGGIPVSIDILVYESYLQALHVHGNPLVTTHVDQLALFLARRVSDQERMATWVKLFALRHGLDPDEVRRRASLLKARIAWDKANEHAAAFRDIYRLEPSFGLKMRDVYEASIVAATVLRTRPNRMRSYLGTIKKWFPRLAQRARGVPIEPIGA
ncbi:MAG: hypothetical protein NVS3B5_09400 [Sphingomicrobium sp.]